MTMKLSFWLCPWTDGDGEDESLPNTDGDEEKLIPSQTELWRMDV